MVLVIDEFLRWKIAEFMIDKFPGTFLNTLLKFWVRYFGPPLVIVVDQGGATISGSVNISGSVAIPTTAVGTTETNLNYLSSTKSSN